MSTTGSNATVAIRLQPRARRNEIVGWRHGALVVKVSAPPVDGKANRALCTLIAKTVGVPSSAVSVVRGAAVREKILRVEGLDRAELHRALGYSP
jgi:uncharacterized protein (TIGR00251 family)